MPSRIIIDETRSEENQTLTNLHNPYVRRGKRLKKGLKGGGTMKRT